MWRLILLMGCGVQAEVAVDIPDASLESATYETNYAPPTFTGHDPGSGNGSLGPSAPEKKTHVR